MTQSDEVEVARQRAESAGREHARLRHLIVAQLLRSRWPNAASVEAHLYHYLQKGELPELIQILDGNGKVLWHVGHANHSSALNDLIFEVSGHLAAALYYVPLPIPKHIGWTRGDQALRLQLPEPTTPRKADQ